LEKVYVKARGEAEPSEVHLTGQLTMDQEGQATGDLRLRLTGVFYDPMKLDTADSQEALVKRILGRLLEGFEVKGHSIAALSDAQLRATVEVASKGALKQCADHHVLQFGDGPLFLDDVPLPLDHSSRQTAVHLPGAVREHVDLAIKLPDDWSAPILPRSTPEITGDWGRVSQAVEREEQTVRFRRTIVIGQDQVSAETFGALRDAVNALRAEASLLLVSGK
jgi:hypothetical protein